MAQVDADVLIQPKTLVYGIITGLFIPFLSNVVPVRQALGSSLRNALDKFRPSLDDVEVEMVRFENQGLSINQVIASITLLICGMLAYYYIPQAAIYRDL